MEKKLTFSKDFKNIYPLLLGIKVFVIALFGFWGIAAWISSLMNYQYAALSGLLSLITLVVVFISESRLLNRFYKAGNINKLEWLVIFAIGFPVWVILAFRILFLLSSYGTGLCIVLAGYYIGALSSEIIFFKG
jgi:uncharacterized protein YebE (UPF0316 family)